MGAGKLIIDEGFSDGMSNWWSEGVENAWVEDGRLHMKADRPGAKDDGGGSGTVWCKIPHPADFTLEYEARVIASSVSSNNINIFFCYSDPSGAPLYESRASRATGKYDLYHSLNGYIITFLNDHAAESGRHPDGSTKARIRFRRNPGFNLVQELFAGHCQKDETYRLAIVKRGGEVSFAVNGVERIRATDPNPLGGGLIGLRTFRTYLWWDNIRLTAL